MWSNVESDNFAFNGSCIFICLLQKMSNLSTINGRSIISLKERKGIRNFQKHNPCSSKKVWKIRVSTFYKPQTIAHQKNDTQSKGEQLNSYPENCQTSRCSILQVLQFVGTCFGAVTPYKITIVKVGLHK